MAPQSNSKRGLRARSAALFLPLAICGIVFRDNPLAVKKTKEEIRTECQALSAALPSPSDRPTFTPKKRVPPNFPYYNTPTHLACIAYSFDINIEGRTENIEMIFKVPSDLRNGYVRAGEKAIKKWLYEPVDPQNPQPMLGVTTVIWYESF
jgi:hypothetical protein